MEDVTCNSHFRDVETVREEAGLDDQASDLRWPLPLLVSLNPCTGHRRYSIHAKGRGRTDF